MTQIFRSAIKPFKKSRFTALAAAMAVLMLVSASAAKAGGCAVPYSKAGAAPAIPFVNPHTDEDSNEHATIVGLWHVNYIATFDNNFPPGGPNPPTPFPFLESFKTWHGDGTEFENAFLPPSGGNICFGVWKELDKRSVRLHHIGLMFNPDGSLLAIFTVDETDTVASDNKTYKGTFDFKLWPPSYDAVGVGTPISEVKGTTAATRIVVD
jgi:hypothetical protein